MFLYKLFGTLDILAAIALLLLTFDVVGARPAIMFSAYLLLKGFMFKWDSMSIIDACIGVYVFIALFWSFLPLSIACAGYLLIKGAWSWA